MIDPRGKARAFTLLEMLVATAMTAVLAGSLYATLHIAFKARRAALQAVEPAWKAELAVELLRADIQSAVVPSGVLAGAFVGEQQTDGAGRECDCLLLYCTASGARQAEGVGDTRMLELLCEPEEDATGMLLLRRTTVNLLAPVTPEPAEEVLCRGVHAFGLRYFDGVDWQDNWDSTTRDNTLPSAVEVTLELEAEGPQQPETDAGGYWTSQVFLVPCSSIAPGGSVPVAVP
ncbi:MAG: hypothetical protein AMJ81_05655 [Phycisphaerae bacterium SM23_33]|jgi:prepilin-type N-terminal cleavage/methylation domain-containing protein|nr:MAG: hypothetical protein AMJ81_05655 [Phycisphaerae bacterium SM23_33]